jgi:hypothetical protein
MTQRHTLRQRLNYAAQLQRQKQVESEKRLQAALAPMVEALTHGDDACRQAAVGTVLQTCVPTVLGLLIDRLADLLGRDGESGHQAAASLVQLGARSVPALTRRFSRARSAAVQRQAVEVLGKIGRDLEPEDRCELMSELMILTRHAVEDSIRQDLAELIGVLRRENERPSR